MAIVTPLLTHAYLDKKGLTLEALQAACSVPVYLKYSSLWTDDGYYKNSFIFRELVDIHGNPKGAERILPERIEKQKGQKLNDKFVTPGTKVKEGFTPFGFTVDQIPTLKKYIVVMGLADGYRLHQATGLPVFCGVGENNIPDLCNEIKTLNKDGKCIAAADNDLAGVIAAHKSNCHYIIPTNENDWSDIYQQDGLHALKQQANNVQNPLPLFPNLNYPFYQKRQTVKDELGKMLNKLGRCKDLASATSLAISLFEKYEFRMPFEVDCQKFTEALIVACKYSLHFSNLKQIEALINFRIDKRESKSLALTNFNHKTVKRKHNVIRLNGLPDLTKFDFKGVVLFRAWKGIGKTIAIAAPYIEAAKNKGFTLAMCHRMSLTAEMCEKLELTHYKEKFLSMMDVLGLGTCVPSITKEKFQHFIDNVEYVFIDEIAQVLTFLRSKKCSSGQGKSLKTNADVYQKLKNIVKNAKCVLGVDAELNDMVIDFLERCRPDNEAFTIYDINEKYKKETPKNFQKANLYPANKCNVNYVAGKNSLSTGYGDILSKVRSEQNIWIALESCERTTSLEKQILDHKPDTKILVINSKTKNNKDVLAFQKNADKESLKYQVIIHSPVISSGISVLHKNKPQPHFNHTYFIGGGFTLTPTDASQMLARVRYVKNYTVILIPNNTKPAVRDSRSIIIGKEQAAFFEMVESNYNDFDEKDKAYSTFFKHIENKNSNAVKKIVSQNVLEKDEESRENTPLLFSSEFDHFCAEIEESESIAKADFSAGLLWLLKEEGHTIKPIVDEFENIEREIKEAKEQAKDELNQHLINAPKIDHVEYNKLKINSERTWLETCKYLKYYIIDTMNLKELTLDDLELWDDGRILPKLRRYSACFHQTAFTEKENIKHLSHRNFSQARVWGYQYIFREIDISGETRITQEDAKEIIKRVIKHRYLLAEIGIVPKKFGVYKKENDPFRMPKTPMKDLHAIFRLMGLGIERKSNCHRAYNQDDYALKLDKMHEQEELCKQIDFSRLGGYSLNSITTSAELNAEIWTEIQKTTRMLVKTFDNDTKPAIAYLNQACEKNEFDKKSSEIRVFFEHIERMAG